jgi:hypothetical protein
MCRNEFRVIRAYTKEVKKEDFEEFDQTGRRIKSLYSLQSRISTTRLPHFWTPEVYTVRTSLCERRRAKHSMREERRRFSEEFDAISCNGGKSMLIMKNSLWKNNPNFVNDVPMICTN